MTLVYGTFGSSNVAFDLAYGGKNWGNFIAANGLQTGRFLDAPEFAVMHDKGNEENFFDRVDLSSEQGFPAYEHPVHALLVPDAEHL